MYQIFWIYPAKQWKLQAFLEKFLLMILVFQVFEIKLVWMFFSRCYSSLFSVEDDRCLRNMIDVFPKLVKIMYMARVSNTLQRGLKQTFRECCQVFKSISTQERQNRKMIDCQIIWWNNRNFIIFCLLVLLYA